MNYDLLRNSVQSIKMPDAMKTRIIHNAAPQPTRGRSRAAFRWKKPAAALLAVILCLALAVPALAARVETVYELMYLVSPAAAQYFRPVQKTDEDQGIRMEVVSACLHDNTAEIYITMQDLTGDRIDATTDLYDSYSIHRAFDCTAHCEPAGYDAETRTAAFLITLEQWGDRKITGDKITFSVNQFLSHKSAYEGIEIPLDLTAVTEAAQTRQVTVLGGGGRGFGDDQQDGALTALVPGEPYAAFPIEEICFTGIAFVGGTLHMQVKIEDLPRNDNHGYFYLIDAEGKQIQCNANYYFRDDSSETRVDYIEYVFSITPEELAQCKLYGNFWTSGLLTEGNWQVTFPLEQGPEI